MRLHKTYWCPDDATETTNTKHGTTGLSVCLFGFESCFGQTLACPVLILLLK